MKSKAENISDNTSKKEAASDAMWTEDDPEVIYWLHQRYKAPARSMNLAPIYPVLAFFPASNLNRAGG